MATQSSAPPISVWELSAALLRQREVKARAEIIAAEASKLVPGAGIILYVLEPGPPECWRHKATVGDVTPQEFVIPVASGTLGILRQRPRTQVFSASDLRREQYSHLNLRRSLISLAYVPLKQGNTLVGAVEIVSLDQPIRDSSLVAVESIAEPAAAALASAVEYEGERNAQLESISRLTQLYDLEHVFNATIHMNQLLPIVTSKMRETMEVQACNLWMVQGEDLILMNRSGDDSTLEVGTLHKPGEGIATEALDTGKSILITRAEDPRLLRRNANAKQGAVRSVLAVPIVAQGFAVGVIEVLNKESGQPFDEDDYYFLATIVPTVANALHNASLLEAERKIEILETLVEVSKEITSSLNLERIMQVVVNGPQKILTYDRAAIALEQQGKLHLKALSGKSEINAADPSVKRLRAVLEWAFLAETEVYVVQHGTEIAADREETRLKFEEYFAQTGNRAFYAVPLADEQGRLGVLSFESRNPDFLADTHFELIKILASQTTVALRNASLYTEVPFIGVLEPLLQKKQRFMRMEKRRRAAFVGLAIAVALFLAFFPLPMRVVGDATVAAGTTTKVQAAVEGVVKKVYVQEGDVVAAGTILADIQDWDYRGALAAAQAKYATAMAEVNRALAAKDGAEAGIRQLEASFWASEVGRSRERLERAHLRSTHDGVVATPHVEEMVGRKLEVGDTFATVVSTERAQVDVAVDERDLTLLQNGEMAAVKLESFPTRRFSGIVSVISPISAPETEKRVFYARISVPNREGLLRPGMQGRSKISAGWHPAGYVLFRGAAMWLWSKLWSWFGW